ncbi:MAG: lamin tail domain-containing protein [Myxococcales bacterium]|nr:lamin tail domain-containing protein [Myxococcales bacterium]
MRRVLLATIAAGVWCGCGPSTNTTDPCVGRKAGDVVITEVMADPEGTDTGKEWIEIFNTLGTPLELKGMVIQFKDTDGSGLKSHTIRSGSVPARSSFTLGDIRSGPNPAWINYSYADSLGALGNARGVVTMRCGMITLDEMSWTVAAKANRSRMLDGASDPNAETNDSEAAWCDTPAGMVYFGASAGTPGAANPVCVPEAMTGTCVDNGTVRPITAPQPGDLVITEVLANPAAASDTTGEWIELLARAPVDLNDLTLYTSTGDSKISSGDCLRVNSGEYALLARSADTFVNGDLPTPTALFSTSFADTTNQRIGLARGDAGIDEIALYPSSSGRAWQLDPTKLDPGSNDSPDNFCKAQFRWGSDGGGDFGSPKVANPDCPPPDSGTMTDPDECIDPISLAVRPVVRPNPGDVVITEWLPDPNAVSDTNGEFIEVLFKADADLNGVALSHDTSTTRLSSPNCLAVTANTFAVFGRNTDPLQNGGLPALSGVLSFGLTNSGGHTLAVTGYDGGVLDSVTYSGSSPGASSQLSAGLTDPADNDVPGNLCVTPAGVRYGGAMGDRGTPGLVNVPCSGVVPDAGEPDAGLDGG